jgi:hypothetical protein
MSEQSTVVAIYASHVEAEEALEELHSGGIDMKALSIVGKDTHTDEHAVGYYNASDRMKYWGKNGAFWGGFWGLMFGSAFLPSQASDRCLWPARWSPGSSLEGAVVVGGLSAFGAGLYSIGIPKDSIVEYETALKTDKFLLVVHAGAAEVEKARLIIKNTSPIHFSVHSAEVVAAGR